MDKSLREIRSQLLTDIKSVLDEKQTIKFDEMIEKYRSQRKREYEEWKKRKERSQTDRGDKDTGER
jgi:hypothetical protein